MKTSLLCVAIFCSTLVFAQEKSKESSTADNLTTAGKVAMTGGAIGTVKGFNTLGRAVHSVPNGPTTVTLQNVRSFVDDFKHGDDLELKARDVDGGYTSLNNSKLRRILKDKSLSEAEMRNLLEKEIKHQITTKVDPKFTRIPKVYAKNILKNKVFFFGSLLTGVSGYMSWGQGTNMNESSKRLDNTDRSIAVDKVSSAEAQKPSKAKAKEL